MSTSPTSPAAFTGTSTYSTQLQTVLTRAIAIESLGLDSLQNNTTNIEAQSTAVNALDTAFTGLQNAVTAIQTATGSASLSASVSTSGVVQPTLSTGALPGTYSIEVTKLGSTTSTLSEDGLVTVSDPTSQNIDPAASFTLAINGVDTTITPAAANLNSLVSAINAQTSLNVQASIVNVGSSASPDYRLAVQSTTLGPTTIQLTGTKALLNNLATGALTSYKVNGETAVTSDSNTITLSPGLSVNLLQQSPVGVPTTITVTSSTSSVSSALSAFATAYNTATSAVNQNTGTNTSAITGNPVLGELQQSLNDLAFYDSGSGSLSNLTSLGFSFDKTGVLSFDPTAFATATAGNTAALNTFLGDASSGFLQSATATLSNIEDPTSGYLKTEEASLTTENTNNNVAIAAEQAKVNAFTTAETAQISAADALISSLEATNTFVTGLFAAENAYNAANPVA